MGRLLLDPEGSPERLLNSTPVHEVDTKSKTLMAVLGPTARQIGEFLPEGP
jgi:hypothetical protein